MAAAGLANPAAPLDPVLPRDPQQGAAAQPQPRDGVQHEHFQNVFDPLAPLDARAQAAQDRLQQRPRDAGRRRHGVDRHGYEAANEQAARPNLEAGRRQLQDLQNQLNELERLGRQIANAPPLPALPAFGLQAAVADARNAGANVEADGGVGGGIAFGGHANRAIFGRHRMDNWVEEQVRNVRRP